MNVSDIKIIIPFTTTNKYKIYIDYVNIDHLQLFLELYKFIVDAINKDFTEENMVPVNIVYIV